MRSSRAAAWSSAYRSRCRRFLVCLSSSTATKNREGERPSGDRTSTPAGSGSMTSQPSVCLHHCASDTGSLASMVSASHLIVMTIDPIVGVSVSDQLEDDDVVNPLTPLLDGPAALGDQECVGLGGEGGVKDVGNPADVGVWRAGQVEEQFGDGLAEAVALLAQCRIQLGDVGVGGRGGDGGVDRGHACGGAP